MNIFLSKLDNLITGQLYGAFRKWKLYFTSIFPSWSHLCCSEMNLTLIQTSSLAVWSVFPVFIRGTLQSSVPHCWDCKHAGISCCFNWTIHNLEGSHIKVLFSFFVYMFLVDSLFFVQNVRLRTEAQTNQRWFYAQTNVCGCKCFMEKKNVHFLARSWSVFFIKPSQCAGPYDWL